PKTYAETGVGDQGRPFYSRGLIHSMAELEKVVLPDPHDDALYAEAEAFARQKGDRAAFLITRVGIFSTMLSIGFEDFSVALYEDRAFVEALLDRYIDWTVVVAERVSELGFDVYASTDDMAFKSAPFFSPAVFRELVLPRYQRVAQALRLPWVVHSDGHMTPFLDDLASLGIAGMHPNERGAMDIRAVKRDYGDRLCVLGNVDLDLLARGMPHEVDAEARSLLRDLGPGGGYILTSGNSLTSYLKPENVLAMATACRRYGTYPISC
ncbi:MAG: uroporphyrinogen decarboxylase family protein, partial [Planctomycetota bacterium]